MTSSLTDATDLLEQLRQIIAPPTQTVQNSPNIQTKKPTFAALLSSPNDISEFAKQLPTPQFRGDITVVKIEPELHKEQVVRCRTNLIGRIVLRPGSKPMKTEDLQSFLHKVWQPKHHWHMTPLPRGFYDIHFTNEVDMRKVWGNGSCTLSQGVFRNHQWEIWVQLKFKIPSRKSNFSTTYDTSATNDLYGTDLQPIVKEKASVESSITPTTFQSNASLTNVANQTYKDEMDATVGHRSNQNNRHDVAFVAGSCVLDCMQPHAETIRVPQDSVVVVDTLGCMHPQVENVHASSCERPPQDRGSSSSIGDSDAYFFGRSILDIARI
ncbi:DUF4283 domain protein [Melia azedarach]|uniref:DUF4283 domain protein n=1 Tax=Melia azedarach TaxID=155640 RepID=A0ACC1X6F6_MELAZ|nr:DUF4283 domain protein [Melia azedarach]